MQWIRNLFDPALPKRTRLLRGVLLGLLVAACAARVWMIVRYNPMNHIGSDPGRHWHLGTHPLDTQPLAAIDPIGYQIYIAILAKLTVYSPWLVAYWTALLSVSGPWLWYRFLRELLPSRDWALAGWVVLAALPSWSAIYSYFMQETVLLPLLGAALWATWRCRRKRDTASFVIAVGIWLLAGLTRGICIPLAAVAMTWLWFAQGNRLAKAAFSMALLLAVLGPLAGRSWAIARVIAPNGIGDLVQLYHRAGTLGFEVEFTRKGGKERWSYNFTSPAPLRPPFEPFSDWQSRREWNANFSIDLDAGRRDWQAARARLPAWEIGRIAWLTGDNLIHLFFSQSWPDTNPERSIGMINHWLRWVWAPLAISCFIVTLARWRQERERLLPALIATWFVVQGLFPLAVNEGRYRKPFEGLIIAQCLLLAVGMRRGLGEHRSRTVPRESTA
jgi:hypothetical protein